MGIKTRIIVTDSFDGKELPEDTTPIRVQVGRRAWDLYLCEDNTKKFYEQLRKWTRDEKEQPVSTAAPRSRQAAGHAASIDPEQRRKIREWAQATGFEHNGKKIGDRGRIPQEVVDAYNIAN